MWDWTWEGVLFMNRMNDISFLIAGKLVVLIEHQSTINPNIPLPGQTGAHALQYV
jgi:hypothetical protein